MRSFRKPFTSSLSFIHQYQLGLQPHLPIIQRRWIADEKPRHTSSEFSTLYQRPIQAETDNSTMATKTSSDQKIDVLPPTSTQLWRLFLNAAVPMMGFGFIDNFIMLQAGEYLDTSIGVTFGISTLTAAAVGQIFSDVSGVAMGGIVQAVAGQHLPVSGLNPEQRRLGITRIVGTAGRMIGVVCGCLLGMTSLLFMDLEESQRLRRFKELQPILTTIIRHTKRLVNVSTCRIYLLGVDSEGQEILFEVGELNGHPVQPNDGSKALSPGPIRAFSHHFNRHSVHHNDSTSSTQHDDDLAVRDLGDNINANTSTSSAYLRCVRVGPPNSSSDHLHDHKPQQPEPIVTYVARTGEAVMCVKKHPPSSHHSSSSATTVTTSSKEFQPDGNSAQWISSDDQTHLRLTPTTPISNAVLCYPVFDDIDRDRVIGVIELADKIADSPNDVQTFTREDERLVRMLSEHLSLYLAMTNYRNATSTEELESVEKIPYLNGSN